MEYDLRSVVEFKGVWGFAIYNGDQFICDSWSVGGFPMAKNPDSEWEREECQRVADEAMQECKELWGALDAMA